MESLQEQVQVIEEPQQAKCAVVLVLDSSGSMGAGDKIGQLNRGLQTLREALDGDGLARMRVELAVVAFGGSAQVLSPFALPESFDPPVLQADGATALAEALQTATGMLEDRKKAYRAQGVSYYRPWIFLVTDAERQGMDMQEGDDRWNEAVRLIHQGEADKKFLFFGVGVEPADMGLLGRLCPAARPPVQLKSTAWQQMFLWLSSSLGSGGVAGSAVGAQVSLPPVSGWAAISS